MCFFRDQVLYTFYNPHGFSDVSLSLLVEPGQTGYHRPRPRSLWSLRSLAMEPRDGALSVALVLQEVE